MTPRDAPMRRTDIALSIRAHERLGNRRTDQAWLEATWADQSTRVLLLATGKFPVVRDRSAIDWRGSLDVPDHDPAARVFLGAQHEVPRFAVLLDEPLEDGKEWVGFRSVGPAISADDAGLLVHALALAEWHSSHRHCPRCGGRLTSEQAGHLRRCTGCGGQQFPRADPAVIMLVTDGDRALLGRQPSWPEGRFSTLAGFVDPGESLEEAVIREVQEEVGIEVDDVAYFGNQPWPFPASLMVGFFARAVTTEISVDEDEISDARWFSREEMRTQAEQGTLVLPGGISISRSLVESWYGSPLPGQW